MSAARRPPGGLLVTGATTPIGIRLCASLLGDPRTPWVLAVGLEPAGGALLPPDPRLVYRAVDLTRPRLAHELLFGPARDLGVEGIIHLSMHRSPRDRGREVHALNVDALRSLLELAERHPTIRRLVLRSHAEVYRVHPDLPTLVTEDHPLDLSPGAGQWVRDRVEADLTACARMGLSRLEIAVLRCAEVLAPGTGSQLWDYLSAPVCFRPLGYDPMMNVLSPEDAVDALTRAARARGVQGVFNVPGADTLPLSEAIRRAGRPGIPLPGAWITPLYRLRRRLESAEFSYGMNWMRFHFPSVLDGTRAQEVLGYSPRHPVAWEKVLGGDRRPGGGDSGTGDGEAASLTPGGRRR